MIQFEGWPKTERLSNTLIAITEKIDGTNAAVVIERVDPDSPLFVPDTHAKVVQVRGEWFSVGAQSRKRLIHPASDNYGFARWAWDNAVELADLLGPGRHFGEWWGLGIQRAYGMDRKVFSLFDQHRWSGVSEVRDEWRPRAREISMTTVPLLYTGKLRLEVIDFMVGLLGDAGSFASPEWGSTFDRPEGVVTHFPRLDVRLKSFVENDDTPKGLNS